MTEMSQRKKKHLRFASKSFNQAPHFYAAKAHYDAVAQTSQAGSADAHARGSSSLQIWARDDKPTTVVLFIIELTPRSI